MTPETAFVGDIHGNLRALQGICNAVAERSVGHTVFLGDYINKGDHSAEVLTALISLAEAGHATLLAGNHEQVLLQALERDNLAPFLKIGGAKTIRSYMAGRVGADVLADFREHLPENHVQALRNMPDKYERTDVVAAHAPRNTSDPRFQVSAHVDVGAAPRIGSSSAQIDTGCSMSSGRLTALLWPSRQFVQVDHDGRVVRPSRVLSHPSPR